MESISNQIQQVSNSFASSLRAWGWYGLIFVLIAGFMINPQALNINVEIVIAYAVLLIGFKGWYDINHERLIKFGGWYAPFKKWFKKKKLNEGSILRAIIFWLPAFFGAWVIMFVLKILLSMETQSILPEFVISTIAFQVLIVSVVETIVFHVILPMVIYNEFRNEAKYSHKVSLFLTFAISQFLFSIFHWYAFSGDLSSFIWAFILGCNFLAITLIFSISACMGVHASYNLFVLGITSQGIIGITQPMMITGYAIIVIAIISSSLLYVSRIKAHTNSENKIGGSIWHQHKQVHLA